MKPVKRIVRPFLVWAVVVSAVVVPLTFAAVSPLLAWRDPAYIAAGFAGILAMTLLLIQPVLATGLLQGLSIRSGRRVHRWTGGLLIAAIFVHVGGLWITSPPDVIDALLFRSPTPFSAWGVVAMWTLFAAALVAAFRYRIRLPWPQWQLVHTALALITVTGSVAHALLIVGTMETISKVVLCALVVLAALHAFIGLQKRISISNRRP